MQLLSLLMKTDVHCVWLANGGRKRLTTRGLLLTNYSEMHGISLANVVSCSASTFQLKERQTIQKNGGKKIGCKREENWSCVIYMPVYLTKFSSFSEMNKSKPLIIQNGLCLNMQYKHEIISIYKKNIKK